MNAQSFARCETNRAFINVQRMHDSGRTKSLHDAPTPTTAIRHPAKLPLPQTGIALLFWCRGANSHCAGRAWMHDSGCTKSLHNAPTPTTANARMHKDSHTEPLHDATALCGCRCTDATAQMAVDAQMWQPKWLTRQGCLQATTYTIFNAKC